MRPSPFFLTISASLVALVGTPPHVPALSHVMPSCATTACPTTSMRGYPIPRTPTHSCGYARRPLRCHMPLRVQCRPLCAPRSTPCYAGMRRCDAHKHGPLPGLTPWKHLGSSRIHSPLDALSWQKRPVVLRGGGTRAAASGLLSGGRPRPPRHRRQRRKVTGLIP